MKKFLLKGLSKELFVLAVLAFFGTLTYSNALNNPFLIDDHALIFSDQTLHNWRHLGYQFVPDLEKTLGFKPSGNVYYRPLAHIFPGLCFLLFQEKTLYYHLVNLFLFVGAAFVVYLFLKELLRDDRPAFLAALLFCIHPVNGLMVNYITASVFSLQVIFLSLSCLFFYRSAVIAGSKKHYWLSLLFFVLSLLCHETSLVLPFCLMWLWICFKKEKTDLRQLLTATAPFLITAAGFFVFRLFFASLGKGLISGTHIGIWNYTVGIGAIVLKYLSELLFFNDISLQWIFSRFQAGGPLYLVFLIAVLSAAAGLIYLFKKGSNAFGLGLMVLGLLPVLFACLFRVANGVSFETHWMFFPNIGFFILLSNFFLWLLNAFNKSVFPKALFIIVLVSMIHSSRLYNKIWSDPILYCRHWLEISPRVKSIYFYMAYEFEKRDEKEKAREVYYQSLGNGEADWYAYTNLALLDMDEKNYESAEKNLLKARILQPYSYEVYNNLAAVYLEQKKYPQAEKALRRSLELNFFAIEPRLNLAEILLLEDKQDEALLLYEKNYELNPYHKKNIVALATTYFYLGQKSAAIDLGEKALSFKQDDDQWYLSLAILFSREGFPDLARKYYMEALRLDNRNPNVYSEMGKLFGNYNRFDEAIEIWRKGMKVVPQEREVFDALIKEAEYLKGKVQKVN
ncbi:MAG: tetratricopeptide repeat protein [Candidatus Omnitrophota bacterium]